MNAILKEEPPDLSIAHHALPPAIDRIVRRALEKDPAERFQLRVAGFAEGRDIGHRWITFLKGDGQPA